MTAWNAVNCNQGLVLRGFARKSDIIWRLRTRHNSPTTKTRKLFVGCYEYEPKVEGNVQPTYFIGTREALERIGFGWAFETERK